MCGIVGVAGRLEIKDEHLIKRLLLIDWLRGPDSTGLAAVRNTGEVITAKVADHPIVLFDTGRFKSALTGLSSKAFIGHNRATTRGKTSYNNAHPFTYDHITGVHNGSLEYGSMYRLEDALGEKFEVDSQMLIAGIARLGLKETIGMIEGAWSLVWHDAKDNTINMLRNKERPMNYAYGKDFRRLFFASDHLMLEMAIRMTTGYEMFADKNKVTYFQTSEDTHYKWDLAKLEAGGEKIPKPTLKKILGKKKETAAAGPMQENPFCRREQTGANTGTHSSTIGTGTKSTRTTDSAGATRRSDSGDRQDIMHIIGKPDKPFGGWLDREEFDKTTGYGCSWCEKKVPYGVVGVTIFERDSTVLCPDCSGQSNRNTIIAKNRLYV